MKMLRVRGSLRPGLFPVLAILLVCTVLGYAAPRAAQPAAPLTELSSNRYLLIVDTSLAMEPRARAMLKTVQELLKSGMGGQMREGDTLGVWTYNAQLYAGRLPLQRWSPAQQKAITSRSVAFLKSQKLELLPLLDNVLPALDTVLRNSHLLTVILVTGGDGLMQGTPFDHRINEFWDSGREKQKTAKMPFVVVLRARDGEIKNCTLNLPPGPVEMPPLPAESQVTVAPPVPAAPEAPLKAQPPPAPLPTISGTKAKPLQPPKADEAPSTRPRPIATAATEEPAKEGATPSLPAPNREVETAKAEQAPVKPNVPVPTPPQSSNAPSVLKAEQSKPSRPIEQIAKAEPKPAPAPISNAPPAIKVEQPKPPPTVAETAKAEPQPTPVSKQAPQPPPDQTQPVVQPAVPPPAPVQKPETGKAPAEQLLAAAPAQPPAQPMPAAPKPEPAKASEPKPAQAAPVQAAAAPLPPPPTVPAAKAIEAPKLAFGPKPTFEPASSLPATPIATTPVAPVVAGNRGATAPQASPGPPVQAATATPAESFLSQKTTWIAGVLLAAAACGFAWLALRRSRATPHGSLITRSLDRNERP